MPRKGAWATKTAAVGPVAVATVLWHSRGALQLTVVVKAELEPADGDLMRLVGPPTLQAQDRHVDDDPTRSLVTASDVVPYRPQADVWLTGHAHAPAGREVAVSVARLALHREGKPVIDKTLHVVGDRAAPAGPPAPFLSMPLVYERAFGGIGFDPNPVGVGADERPLLPNILDPRDPDRATGFGPVSRYWKIRRRQVSTQLRRQLEDPVPRVPDHMPWTYYQAAPIDQRVAFLRGDEWLVLDGLHPTMPRLQTRLPKLQGAARLVSARGGAPEDGQAVVLVADTLAIDVDRRRCSMCWRGSVPVRTPRALAEMLVVGAVCPFGGSVDWSAIGAVAEASDPAAAARSAPALDQSAATAVSFSPVGRDDEAPAEDDLLGQTRVDPPIDPPADRPLPAAESSAMPSATKTEIDPQRLRYPRSLPDFDEVTDTTVDHTIEPEPGGVTQVQPPPLVTDTEPGAPGPDDEDELPWVHEPSVEPTASAAEPITSPDGVGAEPSTERSAPPRPRAASLPPGPPDLQVLERSLRDAGASDEDIAALLEALGASVG